MTTLATDRAPAAPVREGVHVSAQRTSPHLPVFPLRASTLRPLDSGGHPPARLTVQHLSGHVPYLPMWERQRALASARERGDTGDLLLLLEHNHVYTNGRGGDRRHLLADEPTLARLGAAYHEVDRGGDITYHGPGQLVGYPIIHLEDAGLTVRAYVRGLERAIIQVAAHLGVEATAIRGYTGVWVGEEKLAAIGVRVARGVAFHGFALNVAPDLTYYHHIVPCGIPDRGVTSLSRLLKRPISIADVAPICASAFAANFGYELRWTSPEPSGLGPAGVRIDTWLNLIGQSR